MKTLEELMAEARERAERSGFMDRLRRRIAEDKRILDRLAESDGRVSREP